MPARENVPGGGAGRCRLMEFLTAAYPWIKAFHIVSVIAWMAGLLYLPRLFVYHAAEPIGSATAATFKLMQRRLLRGIMSPAMLAILVFGGLLLLAPAGVGWTSGLVDPN